MLGGICKCCGGMFSHRAGCPESEPVAMGYCEECGEEIMSDEWAVVVNGRTYHEHCAPDDEDEDFG